MSESFYFYAIVWLIKGGKAIAKVYEKFKLHRLNRLKVEKFLSIVQKMPQ